MDVSIIIPVYKRTSWIDKCLKKVLAQSYVSFETIVVDDGSPNAPEFEKIIENVRRRCGESIRFVKKSHNGPAAARNYGARLSSGGILCFLDDDSVPEKDWLNEITRPFKNSNSVALVNGRTLSLDRTEGLALLLERSVYPRKSWATCNIAYRRDVFEAQGGFDESFPEPTWEDNDLGLRARWKGHVHVYAEKAIVYHPHEKTLAEYRNKCFLNGRGAAAFSRKYIARKPLWAIATPLIMSRRLLCGVFPAVWMKKIDSPAYVKFLWSLFSLQGFVAEIMGKRYGKN